MAKRKVFIGVNVTEKERAQVHKLAKKRGYAITSDYLRSLIIADAAKDSFPLDFDVDRGGYRERAADADDSSVSMGVAIAA